MSLKDREQLSGQDLDFLIDTLVPDSADKTRLRQVLEEDEDFRNAFLQEERLFRRVMDDEEALLHITPKLFFEILLHRATRELQHKSYTIEKERKMHIPVFDADELVAFLSQAAHLDYLAHMLSSFTRINTYSLTFRVQEGSWHKIRFNDLDMHSLKAFCEAVEEPYRLALYKRIADICLFVLGLFPEYVEQSCRYAHSKALRPRLPGAMRTSPEEYQAEGMRFYELAAEHPSASALNLSDTFRALQHNFNKARKPLNFIAQHYLHGHKHRLFS